MNELCGFDAFLPKEIAKQVDGLFPQHGPGDRRQLVGGSVMVVLLYRVIYIRPARADT